MMLVSSTAHTFHYKWFVQLVRTHSNQKSVSKLDMVWLQIHLSEILRQMLCLLLQVLTSTTENLLFQTFCKNYGSLPSGNTKNPSVEGFFFLVLQKHVAVSEISLSNLNYCSTSVSPHLNNLISVIKDNINLTTQ
jgi:hypothetical protein